MQEFVLNIRYIVRGLRHEGDRRAAKKLMVGGKYLHGYFFPKYLFIREFCEIPFKNIFVSWCWPARKLSTKKNHENRSTDEEVTHVLRHWSPIYARFALQILFFLSLHPRLWRLRGPTV